MIKDKNNPFKMVPDPYDGADFVLPETRCTEQRRLFFKRMNEIFGFLYITNYSFSECRKNFEKVIPTLPFGNKTDMKISLNDGRCIVTPANKVLGMTISGLEILTRQVFVMIYGSFETYLYQLFERSYPEIGITEDILDRSKVILMRGKWDGKFCKMRDIFGVNYKARDLSVFFRDANMNFKGEKIKYPLTFFDKLAQIRHRIVHASSILEKGNLIFIDIKFFHEFYIFCNQLTDYIDKIFSEKFNYHQMLIDPAKA